MQTCQLRLRLVRERVWQAQAPTEEAQDVGWRRVRYPGRRQANAAFGRRSSVRILCMAYCFACAYVCSVRLGTRKWDGLPLYSSYRAFVGNREVELDSEISPSQLPTIVGTSKELPIDPEYGDPPSSQSRPSFLLDVVRERRISQENAGSSSPAAVSSPASAKKFISPASFYGTAVKPKPKGPLHNPDAPGAIVMKAPTKEHQTKFNKKSVILSGFKCP